MPEVSAKLKEPETKERKFEEVVKDAEKAAVLVLVYGGLLRQHFFHEAVVSVVGRGFEAEQQP